MVCLVINAYVIFCLHLKNLAVVPICLDLTLHNKQRNDHSVQICSLAWTLEPVCSSSDLDDKFTSDLLHLKHRKLLRIASTLDYKNWRTSLFHGVSWGVLLWYVPHSFY